LDVILYNVTAPLVQCYVASDDSTHNHRWSNAQWKGWSWINHLFWDSAKVWSFICYGMRQEG